jgi:hypothetical protein
MATIDFDHAARRRRFDAVLEEEGVDLVWFPISADLEYLTGIHRRVPTFGEVNYTHGWATGAFLARGREPIFVLPRMVTEFDLPAGCRARSSPSTSSTTATRCSGGWRHGSAHRARWRSAPGPGARRCCA